MRFEVASGTDRGRTRTKNEDAFFSGDAVHAVADGMGGHAGGEIASSLAVEPLAGLDGRVFQDSTSATKALHEAIHAANRGVLDRAVEDESLAGMGTTLTAVLFEGRIAHVAHVGDSRAYLMRDGAFSQLTRDHTVVQLMVEAGELSQEEASEHPKRSVITRALGIEPHVDADVLTMRMLAGDQLLLCSDGLTGPVADDDVARILLADRPAQDTVQELLRAANAAGGPDNITVVLIRALDDDARTRLEPTIAHTDFLERIADDTTPDDQATTSQRSRVLSAVRNNAWLIGVLVAATVVVVLSTQRVIENSFFIGIEDDTVVIFQGVPVDVGPVKLFSVYEQSTLTVEELPVTVREQVLRDGVEANGLQDARLIVENLERQAREQRTFSSSQP